MVCFSVAPRSLFGASAENTPKFGSPRSAKNADGSHSLLSLLDATFAITGAEGAGPFIVKDEAFGSAAAGADEKESEAAAPVVQQPSTAFLIATNWAGSAMENFTLFSLYGKVLSVAITGVRSG